jgi:RNA polymerase sigma-70 factor (ECF subfamily)
LAPAAQPLDLHDAREFARAYRELLPSTCAAAQAVLGDRSGAEDVAHDVFTALWQRPDAFDRGRGNLRTYVTLMARSRALDRARSRSAGQAAIERLGGDRALAPEGLGPADRVVLRDGTIRVMKVLGALPDEQREALVLRHVGGLSDTEVASATSVPVGTAKTRIRLGTHKLRTALGTV